MIKIYLIFIFTLSVLISSCKNKEIDEEEFLFKTKSFYSWVGSNMSILDSLVPKIKVDSLNKFYYLDTSSIFEYKRQILESGYVSDDISRGISAYFQSVIEELNKKTKEDFELEFQHGFEISMDINNMDAYQCAQEYEYSQQFISELKVKEMLIEEKSVKITVQNKYGWENVVEFKNDNNQWKISKFCLFGT